MAGYQLTGLSGIAGYQVQLDADAQATPEQRMGDTVDPKHSLRGQTAKPYPYMSKAGQTGSHGPYGPENQLLGDEQWFMQPAGNETQDPYMDLTPLRRAAPWPKGIASGPVPDEGPDAISNQLRQSAAIHGTRNNAGTRALTSHQGLALNDEWEALENLTPGHSDLRPLDRQALSSGFMWGTRDRTQSMAAQNGYGFDSAHLHRRWASGAIPGNTMWMKPGGRPMAKSLPGPSRPAIGVDSPFAGDDLGASFDINGAILQSVPTEYLPPPQPHLAPAVTGHDVMESVVEWY